MNKRIPTVLHSLSELPVNQNTGNNTPYGFHMLIHGRERQGQREGLTSENIALALKQPDLAEKLNKQRIRYFRQFGQRWLHVVAKVGQQGKGYPHVISAYWVNPGIQIWKKSPKAKIVRGGDCCPR